MNKNQGEWDWCKFHSPFLKIGVKMSSVPAANLKEDMSNHTLEELYRHRSLLFINLALKNKKESQWRKDPETPGWFLLYLETKAGQISYHIQNSFLFLVKDAIDETEESVYDGHTNEDVIMRLQYQAAKS
jgi:hypothetical protein